MSDVITTELFARKPFIVEAVRVTSANFESIAAWCKGEVLRNTNGVTYVKVPVTSPLNERQTQGFVGDWVLGSAGSFKVYTNNAFVRSFDPLAGARLDEYMQSKSA